ncbi:hypothetical protein Trydic_g22680 [Trypoxylus dichotomus]
MAEEVNTVPSPPPMPPTSYFDSPAKEPVRRRSQMFRLPSGLTFGHYSFNIRGYRRLEDEPLQKRASILLPHLQQSEKKFFELVQANDLQAVKEFLQENHGFNINCVNFQGVSALHIAVQNRSESMVDFLLQQRDIDIGDCALHAIRDNQIKILQLLLDKLQEIAPGLEFVGVTHSSDFPDHVTPLILASQCGHFEIIQMLIERGHKIAKPHLPNCSCTECLAHLDHDDLLHAETLRLNLYRAVTNPAYICHSTHDPILTAFELSRELLLCSRMVPEFKAAYLELSREISNFAVELIGCCRNTEEMDLILKQRGGLNIPSHFIYPRLLLALDYKQKQFVAHPNTQQMVESVWHGDFYEWQFKSLIVQASYPFFRLLLLPIVAIFCIILPRHSLVKHYSIPLNKMLTHIGGLYHYYDGMVQTDKATGVQKSQASSFVDFSSALKTYFWGIFTMSDLSSGDVVIEALPGEVENTVIINEHTFTEAVGYIAFALFEVLIKVIDNVNVEWTFGKTDLYIDYMDQTVLPPPLNLIPTAQGLGSALEWVQVLTKTPTDRKARFTITNCCYIEREADERLTKDFPILMTQLVQRYFREKDVANENSVSELETLKQEIGGIKQLLKESLAPLEPGEAE